MTPDAYQRHKERTRARQARLSATGRDIGPLPPVRDPARRAACASDAALFCRTYQPKTYALDWSDDHRRMIARMETSAQHGGLFAFAAPRGTGKSSLCASIALWATLYGYQRFVALIGANRTMALELLDDLRVELETNPRLLEDFPEVCYPFHCLAGIANRATGQLYAGRRTYIRSGKDRLLLPSIRGSQASGVITKAAGLSSAGIRGLKRKLPDGRVIRPGLVICDDPQTDRSAASPKQCTDREDLLTGTVLGLAGPGEQIAVFLACTVIQPDDLADRILDPEKHPDWHGERAQLLYAWPDALDTLWARYAEIRADSLRRGGEGEEATAFYLAHQEEMDRGARVAWPQRKRPEEASALQHAMNLYFRAPNTFWSEYQNHPQRPQASVDVPTPDQLAAKLSGLARARVPAPAHWLVAHVDVHDKLLFYAAAAWQKNFTGCVLDYGTWPDQRRPVFTLRDARVTLRHTAPQGAKTKEGAIIAGVLALLKHLTQKPWRREDGSPAELDLILVDIGYKPREIEEAIAQFRRPKLVLPCRGTPVSARQKPMDEWNLRPGERHGHHWCYTKPKARRARVLAFDANHWKSFLFARLAGQPGEPGALSLFGAPRDHRLYTAHLLAEAPMDVTAAGRTVTEWVLPPNQPDNHWLDNSVGICVAASYLGASLPEMTPTHPKRRRRRVRYL